VTKPRRSTRPSTGKNARTHGRSAASGTTSTTRRDPFEDSVERTEPRRRAIVAVIDSPEWDEDEEVEKEIREAFGEDTERETEHEEDNGVVRVLPSTSEEETSGTTLAAASRTSGIDSLPQVIRANVRPNFPDPDVDPIAVIASSFSAKAKIIDFNVTTNVLDIS